MGDLRIPFIEAIDEARLLKPRFSELSLPQQVALKIIYGCPLSATIRDALGWSELDYWAALQERGTYDGLGFLVTLTGAVPYTPQEYRETWAILGRRAGKTDALAATVVAYEAALGGHEQHIRPGRQAICFQIAQDLRMARFSLHSISATLKSMPFISGKIRQVTADRIDLWNGITIATIPPTVKSVRGYDSPVAVLDEVGVWYQDSDSANPDYEIYRAVSPGQAQFPSAKIIGISSPWNKGGLLYQRYEAGTEGWKAPQAERHTHAHRLVLHAPTAAMQNPHITLPWLRQEYDKDPKAFEREELARFQDSLSGFLPSTLLREAIDRDCLERPPQPLFYYVAALDPAFRRDAFGFAIAHADPERGIVIDALRRWLPAMPDDPRMNPEAIFSEIVPLLKAYRVAIVYSDQYHIESLQQLAIRHGFALEAVRFTATSKAAIYANLQQLLNQRRLLLLDEPESVKELSSLERKAEHGIVQINAPEGQHDDLATVIAIAAHKAVWMLPAPKKAAAAVPQEPTIFEQGMATIAKRKLPIEAGWD